MNDSFNANLTENPSANLSAVAAPTAAPLLYDADAAQSVPLRLRRRTPKGMKLYEVKHNLRPVRDEEFFDFEEHRKERIVITQDTKNAKKKNGKEVFERRNSDAEAYCHLWDTVATGREGYVAREDWRNVTDREDKITVMRDGLLYFELDETRAEDAVTPDMWLEAPDEDADEEITDELWDDETGQVFTFQAAFQGQLLTVRHYCRSLNAAEQAAFEKLTKKGNFNEPGSTKNQVVRHLTSKARAICAFFPQICQRSEGYAGRVPAWHQLYVVLAVAERDQEVVRGN